MADETLQGPAQQPPGDAFERAGEAERQGHPADEDQGNSQQSDLQQDNVGQREHPGNDTNQQTGEQAGR